MRVAFYVRVSTERQQHAQTIEQQLTQLRAYVDGQQGGPSARSDRPLPLIEFAVERLRLQQIIAPGITTLERLVGHA